MPTLHVQQRRVPTPFKNFRRIQVGMVFVSARNAFKNRLALAVLGVDMAARKTLLRTIRGGHNSQRSASFFQFVAENNLKAAPSLLEDRTIEP